MHQTVDPTFPVSRLQRLNEPGERVAEAAAKMTNLVAYVDNACLLGTSLHASTDTAVASAPSCCADVQGTRARRFSRFIMFVSRDRKTSEQI